MNELEIRRLYALAMSYDNRKLSEANITAWWEQAERHRWTYDEAREAIHAHHGESPDFLMPAHVTAIIKRQRRQPAPVAEVKALPEAQPSQPERFRTVIGHLAEQLGWRPKTPNADDRIRSVECPHCGAAARRPCTRQITRGHRRGEHVALSQFHHSRIELANIYRKDQPA